MKRLPHELERIAATQGGCLSHRQLVEHGLRVRDAERLISAHVWQRITSRTIATYATPLQRMTQLWAAAIHHDRVGLTGAAALECEGLGAANDGRVDLLGPRGSRLPPFDGCHIAVVPQPRFATLPGPPRTTLAESVARASGLTRSSRQATFYVTWAVQRRLVTIDEIHDAIERSPRSPVMVSALRALEVVEPGVHSLHEFDFARECRRRGFPEPLRQVAHTDSRGRTRYTDVEFHLGGKVLIVEIDGIGHLDTEVRLDDDWRENELALQGGTILRVTGFALRRDPGRFFEQLARALATLRER